MRIVVDLGKCLGYGNCMVAAPELFDLDDEDGVARILQEFPSDGQRTAAEHAVRECPARAISLEEF